MERKTTWNDPLTSYVAPYHTLIEDKWTRTTFDETIRGMIGAGSLICQQIAAHSAALASGENTLRSEVDAEHLTKQLRETAVEHLGQAPRRNCGWWRIAATYASRILPRFARLMSSRTSGGMLSALTSRVGNLALYQNAGYRVALERTGHTLQTEEASKGVNSNPPHNRAPSGDIAWWLSLVRACELWV